MRLFVALPVPDAVRSALDDAVAPLRHEHRQLRWTRSSTWHVTLAFLGEVERSAEDVAAVLGEAVAAQPVGPVRLSLGAAGHFRRQVLWIGVDDEPAGAVGLLGGHLQRGLAEAGVPVDAKPVRAHLTLARPRDRRGRIPAAVVDAVPAVEAAWTATDAVLYRSHLGDGPARHEVLARIALDGR